jgi:hypothetical protein
LLIEAVAILAAFQVLLSRQESRWGYREWDVFEGHYLDLYLTSLLVSTVAFATAVAFLLIDPPSRLRFRLPIYLLGPAVLFASLLVLAGLRWIP